jgi:hypothetical protein
MKVRRVVFLAILLGLCSCSTMYYGAMKKAEGKLEPALGGQARGNESEYGEPEMQSFGREVERCRLKICLI